MNFVSIIIITYNNAEHILDAITSVRDQTFTDWNCTIVDNGSTDDTFGICQGLTSSDDRFRTFLKENEGPSKGRNFGYSVLEQKGAYVHFLDGDDKLHPAFLDRMVGYMDLNPGVGLLGCQFDIINSKGDYIGPGYRSRFGPGVFGLPTALKSSQHETPFDSFFAATGQGPFALFRSKVFEKTTGYEDDFWSHEDSDIFCQMALLSDVHYIPDRLYLKRTHDANLTGSSKMRNTKFRDKWDYYISEHPEINTRVESSLKYYYGSHKPLRDFKVSAKSLRKAVLKLDISALKWSWACLIAGLEEVFFRKSYKAVMAKREALKKET